MRRTLTWSLVCTALLAGTVGTAQAQKRPPGEKYALLVGVRQYDPNELRNLPYAEADVEALAQVLLHSGYRKQNVVVMTQKVGAERARFLPLADHIRKELKGLVRDLTAGDSVLVALAGHGVQFQDGAESYFCPMDARLGRKQTLIPLTEVYQELKTCGAGFKLLLVDACRNDPQADNSRARAEVKLRVLSRPQTQPLPGGVAALFSCSPGERAFEHDRLKHGVFFHYVIEGLKGAADLDGDHKVELDELVMYARRRVSDFVRAEYGTEARQMPNLVGNVRGSVQLVDLQYSAVAALERGIAAARKRRYEEAVDAFTEAIRLDAKVKSVYVHRGNAYREKKAYPQAIADYNRAIQVNPNDFWAYNCRGLAYRDRKDYPQALADFAEAGRLNPQYEWGYINRGVIYAQRNEPDRAIAEYDKALWVNPRHAEGYYLRGRAHFQRNDFAEAGADFAEAIRLSPKYVEAHHWLGYARAKRGDLAGALAECSEAIRLNARYPGAYVTRSYAYLKKGELTRALTDGNDAIRLAPTLGIAYLIRGQVFQARRDFKAAVADYTEAIRLDPRDAMAYHQRALAYRELGDLAHAQEDSAKARWLDPSLKTP